MVKSPAQGNRVLPGWVWGAENGCFGADTYPGDDKYLTWLARHPAGAALYAVAPDVPFDMAASLHRSVPMLPKIRALGYPVALALQNGAEHMNLPWDDFDVAFLAGDTEWKLSHHAQQLATRAKHLGKWVHMGRVNSQRRLVRAAEMGADSADGTYLAYGPLVNLPKLLTWLDHINAHPVLPVC